MIQERETSPKQLFQVLPNNRIDKEVKDIVCSFNIPLGIFLCSKYDVHDNHIYSNQNKCLFLLSIFRVLFFNSMSLFRMYSKLTGSVYTKVINSFSNEDIIFFFILILFTIVHSFSFTMLFILDIVHKHNNVSLILKIQTIHKSIDFSKSFPNYIIWNWISIFITVFVDVSITVGFYSSFPYMNAVVFCCDLYTDLSFFAFDINLIMAIRAIVLLRKYLEEWIDDVLKMNDIYEQDSDEQCRKILETYQHILETYNLYKTIFQVLVS